MAARDGRGEPLPPDEEAVRRLLADARATDPAPPEVVARLDGVLADLATERFGPAPSVEQTPAVATDELDARRRRRQRRRRALVAAAAVVAAVGAGGVVLDRGGRLAGVTSADSSAGSGESAGQAEPGASSPEPTGRRGRAERRGSDPRNSTLDRYLPARPRLTSARLVPQVEALLRSEELAAQRRRAAPEDPALTGRADALVTGCDPAAGEVGPDEDVVAVRYDGEPAQLVVRDPDEDQSVVDLFVCGQRGIVRSVLVDLR